MSLARILLIAFALSLALVNPYVRGDGNGYYAYVRSAVIDGDLQFENEFRQGDPAFRRFIFDEAGRVRPEMRTPTGHVRNQWAVGPAIVWLPSFLLAHASVQIGRYAGASVASDGYSAPYRWSCALVTAICGFAAVLLGLYSARRVTSAWAATFGAIGVWLASPLPVYMYFLPFHVHAIAAFSTALFCWFWLRTLDRRTPRQWLAWGLLGGFMVTVYQIQMALWVVALMELARVHGARARAVAAGAFLLGAFVTLSPHFAVKWLVHGSPFITGYADGFTWLSPRLWQLGFSTEHGMFVWTPVLLLAFAGLLWSWQKDRRIGGAALASFAVLYYVIASYQNWHGLSSFGSRFFLSLTPLFVIGLAVVVEAATSAARDSARAPRRLASRAVCVLALATLTVWNAGLMFQWGTDVIGNRGPVDFRQVAANQIHEVPRRMADFARRYFTERAALTREVERQDLTEVRQFGNRR